MDSHDVIDGHELPGGEERAAAPNLVPGVASPTLPEYTNPDAAEAGLASERERRASRPRPQSLHPLSPPQPLPAACVGLGCLIRGELRELIQKCDRDTQCVKDALSRALEEVKLSGQVAATNAAVNPLSG